ncbi:transporter substrate-binding domain-containing protein [Chitinibacter fontanus]|uniref:Transporter substrate-binding domain-containing protein n=1 Tax=Chitinibacter fontanus TaxID=1737446 RepID=A0A7D5VAI0_9NEIS|nr:transporter substrate-binding domain-containing protein [Chitinibacter fontanus]QLI82018.1 transporter substrate-binding domain-containing protein [Chitinibacter fontanus]
MQMPSFIVAMLLSSFAIASEQIVIYSQYDYPPFWYPDGRGLSQDLAKALTEHSKGLYRFEVQILPRKRLDKLLEEPNWQGLIPWVSPVWFRDESKSRYVWTSPLMQDADLVISSHSVQFDTPESLQGLTLGGILGHRYAEFEALINAGKILRDDAPNQEMNFKKLQAKRVDFLFAPHSSWIELKLNNPATVQGLLSANKPRNRYERLVLISPNNPALSKYVVKTVDQLSKDPVWQAKIHPYNYQSK